MEYKVTIGIPVFKAVDFIEATLNSALAQTYPHLEVLLVDDQSTDGSIQVAQKVAATHPRGGIIRLVTNEGHQGVGPSRNRIIDEARGRFLYYLDSDDRIEPDTIERLVNEATANRAEVVYASYEIVDYLTGKPIEKYQKPYRVITEPDELAIYAFQHMSVFQTTACNSLIDLQFLRQSGIRFIDTMFWEDLAFTYELLTQVKRAVLVPNITYHYICRPGSLSHAEAKPQVPKSDIMRNVATIDYLKRRASQMPESPLLPFLCKSIETNSFYMLCYILRSASRIVPAVSCAEQLSILRHPLTLRRIMHFRRQRLPNLAFWLLGRLPGPLALSAVRLIGRMKKAI